MEPFEYEGIFWQADNPDRKVPGRLRYQPTEGSALSLLGSFQDDPAQAFSFARQITGIRIIGAAEGKAFTLDGCLVQGVNFSGYGLLRQTYYVPIVLEGAEFAPDEALEFDTLTIGFDQLPAWLDENPFTPAIESTDPFDLASATKFSITCDIPEKESEPGEGLDVELSYVTVMGRRRLVEMKIDHQPRLILNYHQRRSLADIVTDINGLQDLVTLAVNAPTAPTAIQLGRSDLTIETQPGKQVQLPINAYWYNAAEHVRKDKPSTETVVGFDQAGRLKGVAKWISVSQKYRTAVGSLLTIRYAERLPEETRLSNVAGAAETFHRIKFAGEDGVMPAAAYRSYRRKLVRAVKKAVGSKAGDWLNTQLLYSNEPRLRQRLTALVESVGQASQLW